MPKPFIDCVFCGLNKAGSREHVLPDALGGVDVITDVCADCNKLLATNDRVLSVESPLSIFVRRELSGVGPNAWDVDNVREGLLLEARATPGTDSMTLVPQLILDGEERLIYCDSDDIVALGQNEAQDRFYIRLRSAYGHFRIHGPNARKRDHKGQDMLKFSPVDRIAAGNVLAHGAAIQTQQLSNCAVGMARCAERKDCVDFCHRQSVRHGRPPSATCC